MKMTVELFDSIINTSVLPRRTTGVTRGRFSCHIKNMIYKVNVTVECDKRTVPLSQKGKNGTI